MLDSSRPACPIPPVGWIRSPFAQAAGVPIQAALDNEHQGRVEIDPAWQDGLQDLEGFERLWLVTWLHAVSGPRLRVTPFMDDQPHGVFATRAPTRPNPIGLSCVRLLSREGCCLHIAGIDVLDGTPVLDIKPYIPRFDAFPVSRAGWCDQVGESARTIADDRFAGQG